MASQTPNTRQKSGPTPSRKQQEAKNYQGILGQDKKVAKERARAERMRLVEREQEGLRTGREDLLPPAHRGAARRYMRNYVDQRYCFAEWMIIVVMALMFGGLLVVTFMLRTDSASQVAMIVNTVTMLGAYGALIIGCIEAYIIARRGKNRAAQRFGDIPARLTFYGFARLIQPRRLRQPRPQVPRSAKAPGADQNL